MPDEPEIHDEQIRRESQQLNERAKRAKDPEERRKLQGEARQLRQRAKRHHHDMESAKKEYPPQ
ncbi:DUF6381 family protein [Streptomyces sp. NPDC091266]|uniref:DUF6381 family protein n=1 Tax=Streptomyces sp. NPDC091266 TaxID=3365978 RepID=UPI0037F5F145